MWKFRSENTPVKVFSRVSVIHVGSIITKQDLYSNSRFENFDSEDLRLSRLVKFLRQKRFADAHLVSISSRHSPASQAGDCLCFNSDVAELVHNSEHRIVVQEWTRDITMIVAVRLHV